MNVSVWGFDATHEGTGTVSNPASDVCNLSDIGQMNLLALLCSDVPLPRLGIFISSLVQN
jgi:hypothetical protein